MADSLDFQKGTMDLMILKTLSWGPAHGYAIARWLEECTDDALRVEEGSLYPALHRLEERGYVSAEWGTTSTRGEAKSYPTTAGGGKRLWAAQDEWKRSPAALAAVLSSKPRLA